MAEIDGSYYSGVGFTQGGSQMYIADGSYFKFYDTDYTANELRDIFYNEFTGVIIINSAGVVSDQGNGSYPPILPSDYGLIILSLANAASNASARMFSGRQGQRVIIITRGAGNEAMVQLLFSGGTDGLSGVNCLGTNTGGELSVIALHTSTTQQTFLELKCFTDGTWSILDKNDLCVCEELESSSSSSSASSSSSSSASSSSSSSASSSSSSSASSSSSSESSSSSSESSSSSSESSSSSSESSSSGSSSSSSESSSSSSESSASSSSSSESSSSSASSSSSSLSSSSSSESSASSSSSSSASSSSSSASSSSSSSASSSSSSLSSSSSSESSSESSSSSSSASSSSSSESSSSSSAEP